MRPTWRNLDDSFEAWAWRNGLGRRLAQLEQQQLLERHPNPDMGRVVRLTELGRRLALGGRDPAASWGREWDGKWRMVLFDLPTKRRDLRMRLWRLLRKHHFGYLQDSVWISPDPADLVRRRLGDANVRADVFLVMEGRPASGESDADVVKGAWNFRQINERYEALARLLDRPPQSAERLVSWVRQENSAWRDALKGDPLLPQALCPKDYLGSQVLRKRSQVLGRLIEMSK